MKGNVFSLWLKEFCALVFTQTVQAFILAIVLILVAMSISTANELNEDSSEGEQAAGVLAIVALTSLSNMESLVKKIFGLESSVTDSSMKGGRGGLLGTIAAMRMAKKALDNAPKIASGAKGYIDARRTGKKAHLDFLDSTNKQLDRYNKLHPGAVDGTSTSTVNSNVSSSGGSANSNSDGLDSQGQAMLRLIENNTDDSSSSTKSSNTKVTSSSSKNLKDYYDMQDRLDKLKKEYEDKKKEVQKSKRTALKNVVSGVSETTGAALGGSAGIVYGLATGDDITKTAGIGIGVGDTIGKGLIDIPGKVVETVIDDAKLGKKISKYKSKKAEYERQIDEAMRKFDASDI